MNFRGRSKLEKKGGVLGAKVLRLLNLRLFFPALALIITGFGLAGFLWEQALAKQQIELARSLAHTAVSFLINAENVLKAADKVVEQASTRETRFYLKATREGFAYFDTIYRLNSEGIIVMMEPYEKRYMGLDQSRKIFFEKAKERKSEVLSNPYNSMRTGKPTVNIVRPMTSGGMLVGELNLSALQEAVIATHYEPGQTTVMIVDSAGTLLAHPQPEMVAQQTRLGPLPILQQARTNEATMHYRFEELWVLGSATRVKRTNWVVLVQAPIASVYRPLLTTGIPVIILSVVVWLMVMLTFRQWFGRNVIERLTGLSRAATAISTGDIDHRVEINKRDEIGIVGEAFNSMTDRLHQRIEMEKLLSFISRSFIASGDEGIDQAFTQTVERIGRFIAADCSYIHQFSRDGTGLTVTAQWRRDGTTDPAGRPNEELMEPHSWIGARLKDLHSVHLDRLEDLPPAAATDKERLAARQVRSLIRIPLICGRHLDGYIGLDMITSSRTWSPEEIRLLSIIGNIIGNALARQREEKSLKKAHAELEVKVTERTNELSVAKERAEAASRAKSDFLANMSHEIRTPMNAILGFTQLMQRDPTLNDTQHKNLSTINHSGEHLLSLINDILQISKIEVGHVKLNQAPFDLHALLNDMIEMFRFRSRAHGLELRSLRDKNIPRYVVADQGKLSQILINLLGNAMKFTESGYVELRTSLTHVTSGAPRLVVEVEDTGVGIAENLLDHIFKPFEQAGIKAGMSGRAREGTGLGLSISREYAGLMGGDITVKSRLGKGSVFRLEIDIEVGDKGQAPENLYERRVAGIIAGHETPRILIADDNSDNRAVLSQMLASVGFGVSEAVDGKEAVGLFEKWMPHLVLMDIRMPVMNGIEATQRIKNTGAGQNTPIIAVSAGVYEEEREAVLTAGCDDFIGKPIRQEQLFETIARHIPVRYRYDDGLPGSLTPAASTQADNDTAFQRLALLPVTLRNELRDALFRLNIQQINSIIEVICKHDSELCAAMKPLADSFDYKRLQDLVTPYIETP